MTVRGGMTQFRDKLTNDNETQIKYTYLSNSGMGQGHSGKTVICDTTTSPQFSTECNGGTFKPSQF